MINFFITILAVLIGVSLIIGVHEFGHFILAKKLGVKVLRFSIGFGKPLVKYLHKGTEYVISILPLGGYVKLLDEREGKINPSERHLVFNRQPVWKRLLIIFAGPGFNLLFAWLAFWLVLTLGIYLVTPKINTVLPGSIADQAGLKPHDRIVQMDHQKVSTWGTVIAILAMKYASVDDVTVTVLPEAAKTPIQRVLNLKNWSIDPLRPDLIKSIGITAYKPKSLSEDTVIYYKLPPLQAIGKAFTQLWFYIVFTVVILWKIIIGVLSLKSMSGPIGLFEGLLMAFKQGFLTYVLFLAWLSTNLAIINLLPIPGLDGSHIVYTIFEGLFKRSVSVRAQILAYRLGVIILVLLMIQVMVNDLLRLLT